MQGTLPIDEPLSAGEKPSAEPLAAAEVEPVGALIFGSDPTPCIVAVEAVDSTIWLYIREGEQLRVVKEPFQPWLLSDQPLTMRGVEWEELRGDFGERPSLRYLARCVDRDAFERLRDALREEHRATLIYGSFARQYLMITGKTLFKGMAFEDLHRVQLDIETSTLTPDQPGARILMIALSDNRGYEELLEGDEALMLEQLVERIRSLDPDVIEGHNLFGFDIPFLVARAEHHGIPLALGRDGSVLRVGAPRSCIIGANSRTFKPAFVHGRHLLDTYLAVQRFDIGRGELESYGLKESAQSLGLALEERIYLEREQIPHLWQTDPDTVRQYCLQDVHETRRLAELTLPTEFYQCQMVPDTLQNLATIGTGEKANLIFVRAYLQARHAIPLPQPPREYPGGYTEVRMVGLVNRVVKADVESLYPSVMLQFGIKPSADTLNVFLPTLAKLRELRLDAKARAKAAAGLESAYWDGLQGSFKILINCFDGDTEVLTTSGIKNIREIRVGDTVYSLNPRTGQVEIKRVIATYSQFYRGKMVHLKSLSVDFLITPNHRCLVRMHKSGELRWQYALNLVGKTTLLPSLNPLPEQTAKVPEYFDLARWCDDNGIPYEQVVQDGRLMLRSPRSKRVGRHHQLQPRYYPMADFMDLIGWYLAEGSLFRSTPKTYANGHRRGISYIISLYQKNPEGRVQIAHLLQRLGIHYREDSNGFQISSRLLYEFFERECGKGAYEKRIPQWLFKLPPHLLAHLFRSLVAGDGDKRTTGKRFTTASTTLRDDVIRLCYHLGIRPTIRYYDGWHRIGLAFKRIAPRLHPRHSKMVDYEGFIYCLTVEDNHTLLAGRNKKLNWIGQSYYGYLGAPFNFNDYDAAEAVTLKGQEIVKQIAAEIEARGGKVIEIDTDGVYFQPPEGIETEEQEQAFIAEVAQTLPEGIRLVHDGRYQAMLSVKTKNYVLLGYDGKLIYKGASLRSRADERFGREFISQAIQWLLQGQPERVAEEYKRLANAILNGELPIEHLCRRERITEKSRQSHHPLYELAKRFQVGDYINVYRRRDGSLGLLEEYAGDEDREHYVEKLYKFACRLEELFPDFDQLFPRPQTLINTRHQASLFD